MEAHLEIDPFLKQPPGRSLPTAPCDPLHPLLERDELDESDGPRQLVLLAMTDDGRWVVITGRGPYHRDPRIFFGEWDALTERRVRGVVTLRDGGTLVATFEHDHQWIDATFPFKCDTDPPHMLAKERRWYTCPGTLYPHAEKVTLRRPEREDEWLASLRTSCFSETRQERDPSTF